MDTEKAKTVAKPTCVKKEHLIFLDALRDSGKTNMFGARPYLMQRYPKLSKNQASEVLQYWMDTF
jgi:hypothetical protein